ncbi:MAG TPA: DUF3352 domain-containing protein [Euzebya sp.]|nr:DUF3352 domain-containing protein [Euzebya sp.]
MVLAVVVVGGGAVLALQFLRGSSDALVAHVPADAVAYGHLNLDPSASNKLGIAALIDRVNDAAGEELISIDGVMADLDADADGIAFATDIDPWLGDQMAIYAQAFPVTDAQTFETTPPSVAAVVTLEDAEAAATFVQDQQPLGSWDAGQGRQGWLVQGQASDPDAVVVAIDGDRLYVGTPDAVRAGLDTTDGLATGDGYAAAVGALPDRVLTVWVDVAAAVDGIAASGQMVPDATDLPASVALGVSFTRGAVDVTTVAMGGGDQLLGGDRIARADLAALPSGGILYGLVPDLGAQLPRLLASADDSVRSAAASSGQALADADLPSAQADAELQQQFGTTVADIASWMGDVAFALAYDPALPSDNAGFQMHIAVADEQAATNLLDTALADLPPEEGFVVEPGRATAGDAVVQVADGRWSLTAGAFAGPGTLAEDQSFTTAVDGLDGETVLYVDIRGLTEAIAAFALPADDPQAQQVADVAGAFDSLVATVEVDGDVTRSVLRVAYGQPLQPVVGGQEGNPPDIDLGPLGTVDALVDGQDGALDLAEPVDPGAGGGAVGGRQQGTLEPAGSGG